MFIEILFKMLLFKGGVLIYAEHCIYIYIYIYIYILLFSLTKTSLHACCEIYILNEKLQTSVYNFERFLFLLFGLL